MNVIIIFGPGACGKMTVGQELSKITGYRLFHNHMTIEPIIDIFGSFKSEVIMKFRDLCLDEFIDGDYSGLIFTYMWALDNKYDNEKTQEYYERFVKANHKVYFVELYSPLDIRLERNKTANRLINKQSKRDLVASEERLLKIESCHRYNSLPNEIQYSNYLRIDNTSLSPSEVAHMITMNFQLQ